MEKGSETKNTQTNGSFNVPYTGRLSKSKQHPAKQQMQVGWDSQQTFCLAATNKKS